MNRRSFIAGVAALAASAAIPVEALETVEHPDGKRFYRTSSDHWVPL